MIALFDQMLGGVTCDCTDVMAHLPALSIDFVLTDPPYLANYRDRSGRRIINMNGNGGMIAYGWFVWQIGYTPLRPRSTGSKASRANDPLNRLTFPLSVACCHSPAHLAGRAFRVPSRGSFVHGFRARTRRPSANEENLGTRAGYSSGLFLAIDNNHGKEKTMSKLADPIHALALSATIDVLRGMLNEATGYLDREDHLAALGTLILFEDQAEDVKAAIRLFRRDVQSDGRRP